MPNRGLLLRALVLSVLLGMTSVHTARAQDPSVEEYAARLAAAAQTLAQAEAPSAALEEVQRDLADIHSVRLRSGDVITLTPLLTTPISLESALARLETARTQIALSAGDRLPERLALLAPIMNRRVFNSGESLWDRFLRWLDALLERLFGRTTSPALESTAADRAGQLLTWLLLAIGAAALVVLLGFWISRLVRSFVGDASLRQAGNGAGDDPQSAAEARVRAGEQARTGSYRAAVRSLYLSALLALQEKRLLVADRSLTNRELLARAGKGDANSLRTQLAPVVSTFDDVWYGIHEPDAETFAAYAEQVEALNQRIAVQEEGQP